MTASRIGLSIVELLIVIAMIGLLLAIGLPALQRARESARNTQCKNNLRQFGTSIHNFAGQNGRLPRDGDSGWGFGVFLLPQLGQEPLFNQLSPLTATRPVAPDSTTTGMPLNVFLCTSFSGPDRLADGFARSNYRGNREVLASRIQLTDIIDGESNTIAIGETTIDLGWAVPGTAIGDVTPNKSGPFGSTHRSGANFLLCDGSVRFIADSVDVRLFHALFTTAGNEPADW